MGANVATHIVYYYRFWFIEGVGDRVFADVEFWCLFVDDLFKWYLLHNNIILTTNYEKIFFPSAKVTIKIHNWFYVFSNF